MKNFKIMIVSGMILTGLQSNAMEETFLNLPMRAQAIQDPTLWGSEQAVKKEINNLSEGMAIASWVSLWMNRSPQDFEPGGALKDDFDSFVANLLYKKLNDYIIRNQQYGEPLDPLLSNWVPLDPKAIGKKIQFGRQINAKDMFEPKLK